MSRLERDLSTSPHRGNAVPATNPESGPMIRRALGRIPHVCVVGAGVAGLRCADILLQHGVKVTILEGRHRVGGRLCQSKASGHLVDLGPNWIHGTDHNPILDLAKETGTKTISWDGRQAVFDQSGTMLSDEEAAEYSELVWTVIEQAMQYSNEHTATIPSSKSLMDFFEETAQELIPSTPEESNEETLRKRKLLLNLAQMWGAFIGSPIQRQSLKFFWMEECIDGENLFVAETYHKVLARIAEPALKGADIKFGQKVTKTIAHGTEEAPRVTVELAEGAPMEFDEVVMTTPLGWLKRNKSAFEPELPARLSQAIDAIGYGHLDKVYITFPTAFWDTPSTSQSSNGTTIPTSTTSDTAPNVPATTAPLHQPSTPTTTPPTHFPGFTHWISPTYTPTNPSHWNQEAVNMAALPGSTSHPTLLFYTYGPTSLHLASLISSSPSPTHTHTLLSQFFHPYYSLLPHYTPSSPSCTPTHILATAWVKDELAGYGSYCNFQTPLEDGARDVEVMREGLQDRGVWLAGEHTAPFVALGTVTGAWWAGEGVGRRIVGSYELGKDDGGIDGGIGGDK